MKYWGIVLALFLLMGAVFAAAPTNVSILINGEDDYTNQSLLVLTLGATGPDYLYMQFSCNGTDFFPAEESDYMPYDTSHILDLSTETGCDTTDGTKTITFKAWDDTNTDSTIETDNIVFDQTQSNASGFNPADNTYTNNEDTPISCSLEDETSGIDIDTIEMNVNGIPYAESSAELAFSEGVLTFTPATSFGEETVDVTVDVTDNAGNAMTQDGWSFTVDTIAPSQVAGLDEEDQVDGNRVKLTWNANTEEDFNNYNVYRKTSNFSDVSDADLIATVSENTSYMDSELEYNTQYHWAVTAIDKAGNENQDVDGQTVFVTVNDTNKPSPAEDLELEGTACTSKVPLSWLKNKTDSDVTKYSIYRDTNNGFENDSETVVNTMDPSNCGTHTCEYDDTSGLETETDYYYKVVVIDQADNNSDDSNILQVTTETCSGPGTPSISCSSHSNESTWYSEDDISCSWNSVSGATKYHYKLDNSSGTNVSASDNSTTSTSFSASKSDGEWYLHVAASNGAMGNTDHYRIKIDTSNPPQVDGLDSDEQSDGDVELTWDSVSDTSGIDEYHVYRGDDDDFDDMDKIKEVSGTSYVDEDTENDTYYYRVLAVDNAGNAGEPSDYEKIVVDNYNSNDDDDDNNSNSDDDCSVTISISVPSSVSDNEFEIQASGGSNYLYGTTINVKTAKEDAVYTKMSTASTGKTITATTKVSEFDGNNYEGEGKIYVTAWDNSDLDGQMCQQTKTFTIDTKAPSVTIAEPKTGTEAKGSVLVKAGLSDYGTGIGKATLSYVLNDQKTLVYETESGLSSEFSYDWSLTDFTSSEKIEMVLEVEDKVGNKTEKTVELTVLAKTPAELESEKLVDEAKEMKQEADSILEDALAKGIELSAANKDKKTEAESALASAEDLLEQGDFITAKTKAEEAKAKYSSLLESIDLKEFDAEEYSFEADGLDELLSAIGLEGEMLDEAKKEISDSAATRKFIVKKFTEGTTTKYLISMVVEATNNSGENKEMQIIEVIPKMMAVSASELESDIEFVVLNDDPIIKFTVNVPAGETVSIEYGLKEAVDQIKVDQLLGGKLIEEFKSPPIVLGTEAKAEEIEFSEGIMGISPTGMFALGAPELMVGLVAVFFIAIAAIVLGGGAYYFNQSGGQGFDSNEAYGFKEQSKEESYISKIQNSELEPPKQGKFGYKQEPQKSNEPGFLDSLQSRFKPKENSNEKEGLDKFL